MRHSSACLPAQALSAELGAFVAGVMLSVLPDPEEVLHKVHQTRNLFVALFLASIGLIMSPVFLMDHLRILVAGMFVVVLGKVVIVAAVVWLFNYPLRMALAVGVGLAQVGEFAFILLSEAMTMHLISHHTYMMVRWPSLPPCLNCVGAFWHAPMGCLWAEADGNTSRASQISYS